MVRIDDAAHATGAVSIDAPCHWRRRWRTDGGDKAACHDLAPFLLETIAGTANCFGGAGQGQQAKLANQIGISMQIVAMAESMLFAHKAGLDLARNDLQWQTLLPRACVPREAAWRLAKWPQKKQH